MVHELVPEGDEVTVTLVKQSDRENAARQEDQLNQIVGVFGGSRVRFSWSFDQGPAFHARSITTDTGWKISPDRDLDILQRFEGGAISAATLEQLSCARYAPRSGSALQALPGCRRFNPLPTIERSQATAQLFIEGDDLHASRLILLLQQSQSFAYDLTGRVIAA